METPIDVSEVLSVVNCSQISTLGWDRRMRGTTKANGKRIRRIIKKHLPDLYNGLALDFHNPYEGQCVKKKGLLVYVHSSIEYFIEYR
jgi:hypothetical protein